MAFFRQAAIFAFAVTALAQTPPSFSPSTSEHLGVKYASGAEVVVPGYPMNARGIDIQFRDRWLQPLLTVLADCMQPPTLNLPASAVADSSSSDSYMALMVDIDKLHNTTFTETLQWYQPDFTLNTTTVQLEPSSNGNLLAAAYGGPYPPAGRVHRYVLLVFSQPEGYKLPKQFEKHMKPVLEARWFWDTKAFAEMAALGRPVAANWYTVSGGVPTALGFEEAWKLDL
jgi:hypothetical protein